MRGDASHRGSWLTVTAGYEFERERYRDEQDNNLPRAAPRATETRIHPAGDTPVFAAAQSDAVRRRLQVARVGPRAGVSLIDPELDAVGTRSSPTTAYRRGAAARR